MIELFVLRKPISPWGDYGDILQHGMASLNDGRLVLQRTGPFVPPISFPTPGVVVTDSLKRALEPCAFTGFQFREVIKERIVRLEWHRWSKATDAPQVYPASGEPEDYLIDQQHDADLAESLGPLWQLTIPETPGLQIEGSALVDLTKYHGQDLVQGNLWGYRYVSRRLRSWLESNAGEWVVCDECTMQGAA
jgi:hypothetical protein